ncbi:hypothetical protein COO60DRAFT_592135 [Scenedesmus sp. NREL 46B-D3]|nr:hypothetical protein COO60DRAFT_592135 [Scenedesmus sp. NREL 46B-D3]
MLAQKRSCKPCITLSVFHDSFEYTACLQRADQIPCSSNSYNTSILQGPETLQTLTLKDGRHVSLSVCEDSVVDRCYSCIPFRCLQWGSASVAASCSLRDCTAACSNTLLHSVGCHPVACVGCFSRWHSVAWIKVLVLICLLFCICKSLVRMAIISWSSCPAAAAHARYTQCAYYHWPQHASCSSVQPAEQYSGWSQLCLHAQPRMQG